MNRNLTAQDQAMVAEKAQVAKELAKKHYQIESGLTRIIRFSAFLDIEAALVEPIKLLEVNENTVPSGVMPLHFGPAPASGVLFPSVIVEVTPDEFKKIQAHELSLPKGWEIAEELPRTSDISGEA